MTRSIPPDWGFPQRRIDSVVSSEALLSETEFRKVLEAERVRTERSASVFSLVLLTLRKERDRAAAAEILGAEVRLYDSVGVWDRLRLAALLPECAEDGGNVFKERVRQRLMQASVPADLELLLYPLDWEDDEPGGGALLLHSGGSFGGRRHGTAVAAGFHTGGAPKSPRSFHQEPGDLEPLLVRPMSWWQRPLDLLVCVPLALVLGLLLLPILAILIVLDDPKGGVFYGQDRVGRGGRVFKLWKFRSMIQDADERQDEIASDAGLGPHYKKRGDPRITRVGSFIRKTSIDELPQLFNVIRGDMTLVGPRPPRPKEFEKYEPWQRRRTDVTPGLTGLWQVQGRSKIGFVGMVQLDLRMIRHWSFGLYLWILARTPGAVLSGRGAY